MKSYMGLVNSKTSISDSIFEMPHKASMLLIATIEPYNCECIKFSAVTMMVSIVNMCYNTYTNQITRILVKPVIFKLKL